MTEPVAKGADIFKGVTYHEGGHALVGCCRGRPIARAWVRVTSSGQAGGVEFSDVADVPERFRRRSVALPEKFEFLKTRVMCAIAGPLAHDIAQPGRTRDADDQKHFDEAKAYFYRFWACSDEQDLKAYMTQFEDETRALLQKRRGSLDRIAHELQHHGELTGAQISALVRDEQPDG